MELAYMKTNESFEELIFIEKMSNKVASLFTRLTCGGGRYFSERLWQELDVLIAAYMTKEGKGLSPS